MFITCRSILKMLLSYLTVNQVDKIKIYEGVNGKPYYNCKDLFFNVSHSDEVFVISITRLGPIGIDLEKRTRMVEYEKLKKFLLSEHEIELFDTLDQKLKQEAILNAWTRKESFFKAVGSGLTSPLKELEISFMPGTEPEIYKTGWKEDEKKYWRMFQLDIDLEYLSVLTVRTEIDKPNFINLTLDNLTNFNGTN